MKIEEVSESAMLLCMYPLKFWKAEHHPGVYTRTVPNIASRFILSAISLTHSLLSQKTKRVKAIRIRMLGGEERCGENVLHVFL